jgi:hypothetical protein
MARVSKGNSLSTPVLQPGWTIEDDGFGLLTCSATFTTAHGNSTGTPGKGAEALAKAPTRGSAFQQDARLTCHKASSVMGANGIQVISADFVGIAKGTMTEPQVAGRFSSNQEPISTHPKFKDSIGGTKASPLNGAVFNDDGSFKRFANPLAEQFYGVTSYLSCGFGITGHFYTSDIVVVTTLKDAIGLTSSTGSFAGYDLLGGLSGIGSNTGGRSGYGNFVAENENDQLLLSGMAIEYFGKLLKVSYDIMYSQDGWNPDIYKSRVTGSKKTPDSKSTSWKGSNTPKTLGSQTWKGSSTTNTL